MSTGYDNLSVTQLLMLNITFPFQYLMRCWNNLDFQMTSVKRVVEYTDYTDKSSHIIAAKVVTSKHLVKRRVSLDKSQCRKESFWMRSMSSTI
jgi:hypothetical protein